MKRFSPAVFLVIATLSVVLVDAIVVGAPQILADPKSSPTSSVLPAIAQASPAETLYIGNQTPYPMPTPAATPTPTPTVKPKPTPVPAPADTVANARTYVKSRVGTANYNCIDNVWTRESRWNPTLGNPNGAYGIPQAFPGTKMASFGSNWRTSPLTQVKWGLSYISGTYGTGCGAWAFWQVHGWY